MEYDITTDVSRRGLGHQAFKARVSAVRCVDTNVLLYAAGFPSLANSRVFDREQFHQRTKMLLDYPASKSEVTT